MKNNFLNKLTLDILSVTDGVSKVKLAKIFYLTHKWLVQNDLAKPDDWSYVRMPLGPVPIHFNTLKTNDLIKINTEPTSLSYNMEVYYLMPGVNVGLSDKKTKETISLLAKFSTSDLVNYTHSDPSWLKYGNGSEYVMSELDIKRKLPVMNNISTYNAVEDNQTLQSQLIEGMIDDIVEVSTALEYPKVNN